MSKEISNKKIHLLAIGLGIMNSPRMVLYAQPRRMREIFSGAVPDIADIIRAYISRIDRTMFHAKSGGSRWLTFRYLTEVKALYVEIQFRVAGIVMGKIRNIVLQINFFCRTDEHIREIARLINERFENGILDYIDWRKVEKKFKVQREKCIVDWMNCLTLGNEKPSVMQDYQPILGETSQSSYSPSHLYQRNEMQKNCPQCGELNDEDDLFCSNCGHQFNQ